MRENGIVLVVDDDEMSRSTYRDFLCCLYPNIKVIQAKNGKEALEELLNGLFPDAIITDNNMPVMDGLELLKFIRNHQNPQIKNMRIVMASGDCSPTLSANTAELNCQLFEKPVCMPELCSALLSEKE